jgi:hypothetical protein
MNSLPSCPEVDIKYVVDRVLLRLEWLAYYRHGRHEKSVVVPCFVVVIVSVLLQEEVEGPLKPLRIHP